jgi:hypothetical protein
VVGIWNTNEEKVNAHKIFTGKYSIKYHLGDRGEDGRITLKVISEKYVVNRLRKGSNGEGSFCEDSISRFL